MPDLDFDFDDRSADACLAHTQLRNFVRAELERVA
jgi:hypothetical protein